jgi:glycosyltransferase involved in cell wall biosynthesis
MCLEPSAAADVDESRPPSVAPAEPERVAGLSAVLITLNEASRVASALASVRWAGEILVLDSGSTDATRSIAAALGARVLERPFTDYADQRNAALQEARGEWVLFLDADETATPALAEEIARALRAPGPVAGFEIPFRNHLGARWMRFGGLYPDLHLRLLRRAGASFTGAVHERAKVPGPTRRLEHAIEHRTYADHAELFRKVRRYAALEGRLRAARGEPLAALLLRVPWCLGRVLLLQSGWRDGWDGWVHAWAQGVYAWRVFRAAATAPRASAGAGGSRG